MQLTCIKIQFYIVLFLNILLFFKQLYLFLELVLHNYYVQMACASFWGKLNNSIEVHRKTLILEPCAMCLTESYLMRISNVFFYSKFSHVVLDQSCLIPRTISTTGYLSLNIYVKYKTWKWISLSCYVTTLLMRLSACSHRLLLERYLHDADLVQSTIVLLMVHKTLIYMSH